MTPDTAPKRRRLRKLRTAPARLIARVPWLRRRQARRLVKTLERYREKGRPIPENLSRLERQLRQIPKHKRAAAVEQMLKAPTSAFVLVTSAQAPAIDEALWFRRTLGEGGLPRKLAAAAAIVAGIVAVAVG